MGVWNSLPVDRNTLKAGDLVRVWGIAGPTMVVNVPHGEELGQKTNVCSCFWFNTRNEVQEDFFPHATLERLEP